MRRKRRVVEGYLDMGQAEIPPRPSNIIMEDRVTGTLYWLTFTGTAPALTISLSTSLPTLNTHTYSAYAGPYDGGIYRLYIASGTLSVEEVEPSYYNARIFARRANESTVLEVTAPNGTLTYTVVDLGE